MPDQLSNRQQAALAHWERWRFANLERDLDAAFAKIDRKMGHTIGWLPRDYEGLADSIAIATAHAARFGYGEDR